MTNPTNSSPKRKPIACTGKDELERVFHCQAEHAHRYEGPGLTLRFFETPTHPGEFFEAGFVERGDTELQVVALEHFNVPAFVAKGLPEAAIMEAASETGRVVVSSTNDEHLRLENEFQTRSAEKVWLRLLGRGLAEKRGDGRYVLKR